MGSADSEIVRASVIKDFFFFRGFEMGQGTIEGSAVVVYGAVEQMVEQIIRCSVGGRRGWNERASLFRSKSKQMNCARQQPMKVRIGLAVN